MHSLKTGINISFKRVCRVLGFFSFKRVLFSQPAFNQCICSLHVLSAVGTTCGVEAARVGGKHREETRCWLTSPLPLDVLSVLICGVSFLGKT